MYEPAGTPAPEYPKYLDPHPRDPDAVFIPLRMIDEDRDPDGEYFANICSQCPSDNNTVDCNSTRCDDGIFVWKRLMPELILQGIITP